MRNLKIILPLMVSLLLGGCSKRTSELKYFPLDSLDGVIAQSGVTLDQQVSADGHGSLRIETAETVTVPIFEVSDINIDNARLLYQAKVKTEGVIGQVYLEMLCHFPERGEFFSRGQATLLTGSNNWTFQETPFLFQRGETPDIIKLNIVINGHGVVWIDDIRLVMAQP
jgi:hypothetical protein